MIKIFSIEHSFSLNLYEKREYMQNNKFMYIRELQKQHSLAIYRIQIKFLDAATRVSLTGFSRSSGLVLQFEKMM
jgi:hypothetical protein